VNRAAENTDDYQGMQRLGMTTITQQSITRFKAENDNASFRISMGYDTSMVQKSDEVTPDDLYVARLGKDEWTKDDVETIGVNTQNGTVNAQVEHFSVFGILASASHYTGLNGMIIGPNPYRPNDGRPANGTPGKGIFFNFNSSGGPFDIEIYTITGRKVFDVLTSNDPFEWDVETNTGQDVASGTYLYRVKDLDTGDERTGKLTVIR
jgi:hypothetical protein